ncbi:sigma-70 family RNA polymerase sigma factor [Olivibacter sp. LS-1]|uniref:sigma-70 family RNA polymerase sigma factor n=1 Tax=unclassified Olivibacter TaxID=2632301 RepID=UPI0011EB82A4|nr:MULTISPECIES: sigma-70 family RNA polymerase sigma factor [unclassified Olivibacter]MDM8172833.1 sigma-70 family RNA polymerase sigma factor [Olivibacter sp. 47]QEL02703.1 sigma-70 family RNA polymerase sigma factor [Olivibacter sp. LS-1]
MLTNDPEINTIDNHAVNPHKWVSRYADYLYTYAAFRINDEDLARDLVQETFLSALERKEKFEGKSSEKTWLTAILKNKIVDVYRSRSMRLAKGVDATNSDDTDTDFFDHNDGHWREQHRPAELGIEQADALENKEFQKILEACMKKLPALWFSVFSMKHIDDETTEMICSELKLTSSNFWVIIHRTKVNLRSCLQKNWI